MRNTWTTLSSILIVIGCGTEPNERIRTSGLATAGSPLAECVEQARALSVVWEVNNGHGPVTAMSIRDDGNVALAGLDGRVKQWDLRAGAVVGQTGADTSVSGIYGSQFTASSEMPALDLGAETIATGDVLGNTVQYDREGIELGRTNTTGEPITAVAQSSDGRVVIADAGYAGNLRVWDPATGDITDLTPSTYLWGVEDLRFVGDALLIAGTWYGVPSFEVWDRAAVDATVLDYTGHSITTIADIHAVAMNDDRVIFGGQNRDFQGEDHAAVGSVDRRGLDAHGDPLIAVTDLPGLTISSVALLPDADAFAAATPAGLRVFEGATAREVMAFGSTGMEQVAMHPAGDRLITSGTDGMLRVWGCE